MRGERDTIFLCWLLLHHQRSTQPTRGARSAQSRQALPSSESQLSSSEAGIQLTAFFQISAHASGAWRHPNTLVLIPIWDFYFNISEWHILSARAWTPSLMLHLTNPCAKRTVLSLTKPKGKIYKTKSLGNYITNVIFWPSSRPKNTIPRWYTGRKWHIPTASNRKRSRGRIKAYDMGQGEGPIVPLQSCTGRE